MEFTKAHEGKTIFAVPTGNNARRGNDSIVEFEVVKVKRKYVELRRTGRTSSDNYCKKRGATQSSVAAGYGNKAGYRFYESKEEIERYRELNNKYEEIRKIFSIYNSMSSNVSDDMIDKIYDVLMGGESCK